MKRQRGRGRKPGGGGHQGNRPLESNGPDVKIRGTAAQIYEKYTQYARDAQSGGDRVKYESYLQHAEHYYRVMAATMPRDRMFPQPEGGVPVPQQGGEDRGQMGEGGGDLADPMKVMDEGAGGDDDGDYDDGDDGDEAGDGGGDRVEAGGGGEDARNDSGGGNQNSDRQGRRRRRGRRRHHDNNYAQGGNNAGNNNNGNNAGNGGNGGGDNEARSALDSLARRQGALAGD